MTRRFLLSLTAFLVSLPLAAAEAPPVAGAGAVSVATSTVKTDVVKPAAGLRAEVKVGTGIQDKEPVGVQENFPAKTDTVVAWSRVIGAESPTTVTHVWLRNGDEVKKMELKILSASYRTHSNMEVRKQPGNWEVQVRDQAGKVIGSTYFNVMDK